MTEAVPDVLDNGEVQSVILSLFDQRIREENQETLHLLEGQADRCAEMIDVVMDNEEVQNIMRSFVEYMIMHGCSAA